MRTRQKIPVILYAAVLLFPIPSYSATAAVNFSTTHQVIDGFGGSTAWSGALSDATMDALYKNGTGQIGLTILRSRIDPNKSWSQEKSNAQKAKARGATTFATPWSPPASMKTNNNVNNGGSIKSTEWANYAAYLKEYIDYVGNDLDIISLQNEPDWAPNYESCTWTATQFKDFCKNYASTLGRPVMMPEALGYNFSLSDPTLDDADAAKNISYMGGHLYGSPPKKYTKALNLGKHVWETEHYYTNDNASSCMSTAKEIMDCMNCDFSAYVWWWMTYSSGEGIYASGAPNHRGWVIGQFSKWVRPGFYRVDATYNPQNGVYVTAFKGTQYVIVAMNNSSSTQSVTFTCSNAALTSVDKYTSSQSKNGASEGSITVTNNSFTTSLDAQSVATFVSTDGVSIMDPYRGVEKPSGIVAPANAAAHFVYLINGKRFSLQGMNEPGSQAPGIFIMPGNIQAGNRAVKSLHVFKK
jgi:glucuronoarabinoxylan endo-1,4-beta-xylanase